MVIQFTDLKIKTSPAGEQGVTVSLVENDPTITSPTTQKSVNIDTNSLNPADKAVVNAFMTLLKSKL